MEDKSTAPSYKEITCYHRFVGNFGCFIAFHRRYIMKHRVNISENGRNTKMNGFFRPAVKYSVKDCSLFTQVDDKVVTQLADKFVSWYRRDCKLRPDAIKNLISVAEENDWPQSKQEYKAGTDLDEPDSKTEKYVLIRLLKELKDKVFSVDPQSWRMPFDAYILINDGLNPFKMLEKYKKEEMAVYENGEGCLKRLKTSYHEKFNHCQTQINKESSSSLLQDKEISKMDENLTKLEFMIESDTSCSCKTFEKYMNSFKKIADFYFENEELYSCFIIRIKNILKDLDNKEENKKRILYNLELNCLDYDPNSILGKRYQTED